MKLPFDFPKRRNPDPEDHPNDRPPTDDEIKAFINRGMKPEGIKNTTTSETLDQSPITIETKAPIDSPRHGNSEIKG